MLCARSMVEMQKSPSGAKRSSISHAVTSGTGPASTSPDDAALESARGTSGSRLRPGSFSRPWKNNAQLRYGILPSRIIGCFPVENLVQRVVGFARQHFFGFISGALLDLALHHRAHGR